MFCILHYIFCSPLYYIQYYVIFALYDYFTLHYDIFYRDILYFIIHYYVIYVVLRVSNHIISICVYIYIPMYMDSRWIDR